jgi:hypothetical protein
MVTIKTASGCVLSVDRGVWSSQMGPELAEVLNTELTLPSLASTPPGDPDHDGNEARRVIANLGGEIISSDPPRDADDPRGTVY